MTGRGNSTLFPAPRYPTPGAADPKLCRVPATTEARVCQPLGRIGELLVEEDRRLSLDERRNLLAALDTQANLEGFEDGLMGATTGQIQWQCGQYGLDADR